MSPTVSLRRPWESPCRRIPIYMVTSVSTTLTGKQNEPPADYSEDLAAEMLATTLGVDFDPNQSWDAKRETWRISGQIVRTRNTTQSAVGDKGGLWTTVMAAAFSSSTDINTATYFLKFHQVRFCPRMTQMRADRHGSRSANIRNDPRHPRVRPTTLNLEPRTVKRIGHLVKG